MPAANCELACTESCERVSSLTPLGEDIFVHSTKIPCKKTFETAVLELGSFFVDLPRISSLRPSNNPQYHNQNCCLVSFRNCLPPANLVPAYVLDSADTIPLLDAFWNLLQLIRFLVHVPSPKLRSQNFTSPRFIRLLDQLRNRFVARRLPQRCDLNHAVVF